MDSPRATVLVVDDEPTLLGLMSRVLTRDGYAVLQAGSAEEALRSFEKSLEPVSAVLIDLLMRPEGGTAVLRHLLARDPALGVVVTSGSALDAETRELLQGCRGEFVRKPFAPEALLRALAAVLAPPSPSPDAPSRA